jgi:hypothetical protein
MKNKKNILIGVLVFILFFALIARSDTKETKPATIDKETITAVQPTPDLEVIFRDEFMKSCTNGASREECRCMYNYVLTQEGFEGMVATADEYVKTEILPDVYVQAAVSCAK